jgi:hypothetical protein
MRNIFKVTLVMGLMLIMTNLSYAQEATRTPDELKAERQQLQSEMKSKDAQKREKKLAELEKKGQPADCGVSSVDMLATSSTGLLKTVQDANKLLSKFKLHIKDNGDGEYDVSAEKANENDYLQLAVTLAKASADVAVESQKLQAVKDEIKSLSPAQAMPASKSVTYSTDALNVCGGELQQQTKLVKNLIEYIKVKKNL